MYGITTIKVDGRPQVAFVIKGQVYKAKASDPSVLDPSQFFRDPFTNYERLAADEVVQDLSAPLDPPDPYPSKIIGIGKNYAEHAREMRSETRPVFFMKAPSALIGHRHHIEVPPVVAKPDYEGEVVIVIGKPVKLASREEAKSAIFGYMAGNDVTARDLQYDEHLPWCLSKSVDTFSPTGPYINVVSDYSELEGLCVETYLNGERVQRGCAADMTYDFASIVQELSKYMKLLPGDLIFTGTPPGVGHPRGRYLLDGDVIEVKVTGLEALVNSVTRKGAVP